MSSSKKITETTCKKRKIKDITLVLKEAREMELPPCRKNPKMSYLEFTKNKNDQTRIVTNYQTPRLYVDDFLQPFGKYPNVDRLEY